MPSHQVRELGKARASQASRHGGQLLSFVAVPSARVPLRPLEANVNDVIPTQGKTSSREYIIYSDHMNKTSDI